MQEDMRLTLPASQEPEPEPGVHIAPENWKRMVSRTATGVIIGAKPGHGDAGPEIYIDLPETVAAWLAVRILDALAKPHTVNEIVASEGYCPSGMTLEAAQRTIARSARFSEAPWGLIQEGEKIWIMHDGDPVSVVMESMIERRPARPPRPPIGPRPDWLDKESSSDD